MARRRRPSRDRSEPRLDPFDDVIDPAEFYEIETTSRVALQRITQTTAEVVLDLERKGALHLYVLGRRKDAIEALIALVDVDPTDARKVYELQRRIHPYFDACDFIHSTLERGAEADRNIEETYGNAEATD